MSVIAPRLTCYLFTLCVQASAQKPQGEDQDLRREFTPKRMKPFGKVSVCSLSDKSSDQFGQSENRGE